MSAKELSRAKSEAPANPVGFRVCLSISGLRCASEGAPLERELEKLSGVRDATVNPLREKLAIEVDALTRVQNVVDTLAERGYAVSRGEIRITTWIGGSHRHLADLRHEMMGFGAVTYCGFALATGRFDLRVAMDEGWQPVLHAICRRLCAAGTAQETRRNWASRADTATDAENESG